MRVAVHDHVAGVPRQQQLRPRAADFVAVAHMNREAANVQPAFSPQQRVSSIVDVAGYSFDGRNRGQLTKNVRAADVAGMDDQLDASQRVPQLRAEETVRVGDEADDERRH